MSSRHQPVGAFLAEDMPSSSQLEYMAFQGQADRVHSIFRRIAPEDRAQYASRHVLSQVIRGGVARLRSTPREAVDLLRIEGEFLDEIVELFVSVSRQ